MARVEVAPGARMAYWDVGGGSPVVFLHGGVAGSELWQRVLPHVAGSGRCLAPDLIGTGHSSRLPPGEPYRWVDHALHLDQFLSAVGATGPVTLVMHGWASIVGLTWASNHEHRVAGICNIEVLLGPIERRWASNWLWRWVGAGTPPDGLTAAALVAQALDDMGHRRLEADTLRRVRRGAGSTAEGVRAITSALASLPAAGAGAGRAEADQAERLLASGTAWLAASPVPKLLIEGNPGYLTLGRQRELALGLPNQAVATVDGAHLLPLESPQVVGRLVSLWLQGAGRAASPLGAAHLRPAAVPPAEA
jgi:haloalkane dehalogenase